jgi:hypothetical protein
MVEELLLMSVSAAGRWQSVSALNSPLSHLSSRSLVIAGSCVNC